jgi:aspartyl-tRNA(Asn)/glutamyl-tRNA(Gln) amidotransferase subunit A
VSDDALCFLSGAELGRRFARREVSPVEVARAHLARIERLDAGLNAFLTVTVERALESAADAGREIAAGRSRGPLHGVPLALKDLFDTAGVRTTAGSRILADHVPVRDAAVVERLNAAGLVMLGKTNLHEFAYGTTSDNPHYGPVRNPWDLERSPGGSSGGSGAALAAGLCAVSLGTDTGGSIRIPAGACGVTGLKPTLGRVSCRGVTPLAWSFDTVGPMARTVEDVALLLNAIAGPDAEDESCSARPAEDFARDLERGAGGLTLGVPRDWFFEGLEPGIEACVREAIAVLERGGARRVELPLPGMADAHTAHHGILAAEASAFHGAWLRERPQDYGGAMRASLELGQLLPAVDYVNARRVQAIVRATFRAALGRADVLVTPCLPRTPLRVGEPMSREPAVAWNRLLTPVNVAGYPAASVPCGFDESGLPVGLQIIGRPWEEALVLRVARAYERATEWSTRRPPVGGGRRGPREET